MHVTNNEILEPTKIFPWKRKILKLKSSPYLALQFYCPSGIFLQKKITFEKNYKMNHIKTTKNGFKYRNLKCFTIAS